MVWKNFSLTLLNSSLYPETQGRKKTRLACLPPLLPPLTPWDRLVKKKKQGGRASHKTSTPGHGKDRHLDLGGSTVHGTFKLWLSSLFVNETTCHTPSNTNLFGMLTPWRRRRTDFPTSHFGGKGPAHLTCLGTGLFPIGGWRRWSGRTQTCHNHHAFSGPLEL